MVCAVDDRWRGEKLQKKPAAPSIGLGRTSSQLRAERRCEEIAATPGRLRLAARLRRAKGGAHRKQPGPTPGRKREAPRNGAPGRRCYRRRGSSSFGAFFLQRVKGGLVRSGRVGWNRPVVYIDRLDLYFGLRSRDSGRYYWLACERLSWNLLRLAPGCLAVP